MAIFAIVGAGLAGVTLARELQNAGHRCQIFEKSRGRGGRLATRRRDQWQADHGAQYFTVRDAAFEAEVRRWLEQGWVTRWQPTLGVIERGEVRASPDDQARYVGSPAMNAMVHGLSDGIDLFSQTRIDRLEQVDSQWRLWDDSGEQYGLFDAVLLTAPLAQSLALLPSGSRLEVPLRRTAMLPTWAVALAFEQPTGIDFDGVFAKEGVISWAARDSSKPGREPAPEVWVMHFTAQWTANHLDAREDLLQQQSLALLRKLAPKDLPALADTFKHRWLYARTGPAHADIQQWDNDHKLGLAGDWTLGDRLEDAWLSAKRLAQHVQQAWS
ncbi:MAG: NAD(P)/FAD-dependent oxidoreductase [Saccharospirillum sp.]